MYSKIQAMKEQGFSIRQVSGIMHISRNTIRKYWEMQPEEYAETYKAANRLSTLKAYEPIILKWLEEYPSMTSAQVRDWLDERHHVDAADRTVRRFVERMREEYGIERKSEPRREYEAVEELPMGWQLQLDFGEKSVRQACSSRYIKLYFVVFTLSYSRYTWGVFQERPFICADLVKALYDCFAYFGGKPRQLVYDQDSIIVVTENGGDIIHTEAFSAFLAESKLEIRVCRKSDPQTKGLIEAGVKYVKRNFMENRFYMGIEIWNESFEEWLTRVSKRKHGTTMRKPVEMFAEEQEQLLPLYGIAPEIKEVMDRHVRADNTVWYCSNRYSVPYGTYGKDKEVFLEVEGRKLRIINRVGETLAEHGLCEDKGKLIKQEEHRHDRNGRVRSLLDKTVSLIGMEFKDYLETIVETKPRYAQEQLSIARGVCETYGRETALAAMLYCKELNLYSANDLRDAAASMGVQAPAAPRLPVEDERYHIPVQKRALSVYAELSGVAQ